ncbi:hypothetical protein [Halodesulfovibrio marinisediminis]|uniref:FeS-binding protein n=1 Tax=Halodesulfovibrio marinisediminis DSM 17456 TaxID=1121457 RepID=A0A1N6F4E6_9BACT|nr:hypothetical protein [Halodesulfovibrio marinisediminis]SIN90086.1 hypothetical protein SAMN02745161_1090 [Halodesulfovibrio marinisediminis DSM 17456]
MTKIILKLWMPVMAFMAITGMGQMPIFKRYYVADIPGLAWLGEPFTVHWAHYIGAAALMFIIAWLVTLWFAKQPKLTGSGKIRIVLLGLIIGTGYVRVIKNLPDIHFSPTVTMLIDWTHLLFAMLLGIAALWSARTGRKAYIKR